VAEHHAEVLWDRDGASFLDNRYSRRHRWRFDGGAEVPASASPHAVPLPMSDEAGVDPEEAFVASVSSCHMLWFLSCALERGFVVDHYRDNAVGVLGRTAAGRIGVTRVTLRPEIRFSGDRQPSTDELATMHHEAHERCFIANSVTSRIEIESR
jgi:organic hydroperoxide reductase OsmC/OhrA